MKKTIILTIVLFVTAMLAGTVYAEKAPQKVVDLANTDLVKLGSEPAIVAAVKAENGKNKSMALIKETDEKWKATPGTDDFMKSLMSSECGQKLRAIQKTKPYYAEIFVMDNQGANVAMTDKTSDYWQGDEDKFTQSYKNGQGAVHISDVEFDDSTQAYVVQVSVPVKEGDQVIGAVTIAMDVDQIQ